MIRNPLVEWVDVDRPQGYSIDLYSTHVVGRPPAIIVLLDSKLSCRYYAFDSLERAQACFDRCRAVAPKRWEIHLARARVVEKGFVDQASWFLPQSKEG